jgi:hypothetical protein
VHGGYGSVILCNAAVYSSSFFIICFSRWKIANFQMFPISFIPSLPLP